MLILKCSKEDCEGHLVGWNYKAEPIMLPNKTHSPERTEVTPEIKEKLLRERNSEPFATFMDIVKKESKK